MNLSIIIVHYKVKHELFTCIESLKETKKIIYEIIVVDNDEKPSIQNELQKKFPEVLYVKNQKNTGYSAGNNLGARKANGEFLFFLNPDTKVFPDTLKNLYEFAVKNKKTGAIAPLLLGSDNELYQQGSRELTPLRAIFALSIVNKLFPRNRISQKYFLNNWSFDTDKEVDVVPGTAFMIRRDLFKKVGGFDEKFFLYFEEFDLANRIRKLGYSLWIITDAKVSHIWGASTKKRTDIDGIFARSRFYYFQKNYGLFPALLIQFVMSVNKYTIALLGIVALSLFLLTFKLYETAPFIGDQGWFYLSARDLLIHNIVPLLGIPSSRPWLHQGPLWTYLLAGALWIGNFNPMAGVYLGISIGAITIVAVYLVAKQFFSRGFALVAALLFATSPAVLLNARMAYHTNPIPLVSLGYIYCLVKIIRGNVYYLLGAIFCFFVLYNFELFAFVLTPLLPLSFWLGYKKHTETFRNVPRAKLALYSILAAVIPMLPILWYDLFHGFTQTAGFVAWLGYSLLKAVHVLPAGTEGSSWRELGKNVLTFFNLLFYTPVPFLSTVIVVAAAVVSSWKIINEKTWQRKPEYLLLVAWIVLPLLGIILTKTASGAYLPVLYAPLVLLVVFAVFTLTRAMWVRTLVLLLCLAMSIANMYYIINSYAAQARLPLGMGGRIAFAKALKEKAGDKPFSIKIVGNGSIFPSISMNHEYLLWWLGAPIDPQAHRTYTILENEKGLFLLQNTNSQ